MKIVQIAVFVFCVNIASAMILASGVFPSGVAPIGMEGLGPKMGGYKEIPGEVPKGGFIVTDEFYALSTAIDLFIKATINAPHAFTYLLELAIPDDPVTGAPTAVERVFTTNILIMTYVFYGLAIISILRRHQIE